MTDSTELLEVKELSEIDPAKVQAFKYQYHEFRKDHHLMTFIERAFGCSLIACYATKKISPQKSPDFTKVRIDGEYIVLFLESGFITLMTTSEWGDISTTNNRRSSPPAAEA